MGIVDPFAAFIVSFTFLGIMIYKRVNLGINLTLTALLLSLLSMQLSEVPNVFIETSKSPLTISLVSATLGIMLLSQLYNETELLKRVSQNLSDVVRNSKIIVSLLPAVIGLIPVAGGALMSAPLIETEANKLKLNNEKKAYVNFWFRHTIFAVYPMSQFFILTVAITGISVRSLIVRQIPVALSMVIFGYFVALRSNSEIENGIEKDMCRGNLSANLKPLLLGFSPVLTMIFAVAVLRIDASIAAFIGVVALLLVTKPDLNTILIPFRKKSIYEIALAAFGAVLLRNVTISSGVSDFLGRIIIPEQGGKTMPLLIIPAIFGLLSGSPEGGIAISVPILTATLSLTQKAVGLIYIAAYLGYLGSPTHLCLVLTAKYFRSPLGHVYKYLLPSLAISFVASIAVYFLI